MQPTLAQLLAAYPDQMRLVFKNQPLPFHEHAALAAEAALAAHEQGKFWEMHDRLFQNQAALGRRSLEDHAKTLGLDLARFRKALDDSKFREQVAKEAQIANEAGLRGTPSFLINGVAVHGAQPLEYLKAHVERAIARAKGLPLPPEPVRPAPSPSAWTLGNHWPPPRVALPDELLGERVRVPFAIADAPWLGPSKAPVEILYFNDVGCASCSRGKTLVDGLRRTYGDLVRIVAIPLPASRDGWLFAQAAWAAHAQGAFWKLHDRLLSTPETHDREALFRIAGELGLDLDAFRAALEGTHIRSRVEDDVKRVVEAGFRGGPAFVVNGRCADGPVALVLLVEGALKAAGRVPPPLPAPTVVARPQSLAGVLSSAQLFFVEPREEAWAATIEQQLGPVVLRDLRAIDPGVTGVKIECKTSLCRIRWKHSKKRLALRAFTEQVYRAGWIDPRVQVEEVHMAVREQRAYVYGPGAPTAVERNAPQETTEASLARFKSRRAASLFGLRTGRTKAREDLPVELLPKE